MFVFYTRCSQSQSPNCVPDYNLYCQSTSLDSDIPRSRLASAILDGSISRSSSSKQNTIMVATAFIHRVSELILVRGMHEYSVP